MVQSEGGEAEEIVDEESGLLISTIIRQYFMGRLTVGQWANLSEHWHHVAAKAHTPSASYDMEGSGYITSPTAARPEVKAEDSTQPWVNFLERRMGLNRRPLEDDDSDGEEEAGDDDRLDFETLLMRKFFSRWAQKAKVKGGVCDPLKDGEYNVDWTRIVAPELEGRIKIVE